MKDLIFILGFLSLFVINTATGYQTWKEDRPKVFSRFTGLYQKDVILEKNLNNQNVKINENKEELVDLRLLVEEKENETKNELKNLRLLMKEKDNEIIELKEKSAEMSIGKDGIS